MDSIVRDGTLRRQWPLMIAGSLLLAACTDGSPAPTDRSAPESTVPPRAEQIWSLDAPVIGQPVAAGDVALVYVAQAQELALVGVDAATGEQLWSKPASPGEVVPGIAVLPTVVDTADGDPLAAYFRPDPTGNLFARLVLANPRTGQDVVATPPLLFGSTPAECPDERDVCVQARSGYEEYYSVLRLSLADGTLKSEPDPIEGIMRVVGPEGLSDVRSGDVQYLARVEDGAVVWQTPIAELFGPGYSTDGGWAWYYYSDEDLFVGFVGLRPPDLPPGTPRERDLAAEGTVAIDASTGERVWRDDASAPQCNSSLPIPRDLAGDEDTDRVPVRCRYEGSIAFRQDEEPVFANLDVTVEGFDVQTGDTTWTLPLGAVEELVFNGGVGAVAGPEEIVLPGPDGPTQVNLLDGTTRDPNSDEVLACDSEQISFDYPEPYYPRGYAPITERSGGTLTVPCRPDGTPTAEPMLPAVIEAVGLEEGDLIIVAVRVGLVGYQLG